MMHALLTNQDTAAAETALCDDCYVVRENRSMIRLYVAGPMSDVNRYSPFVDCTENDEPFCAICGNPS